MALPHNGDGSEQNPYQITNADEFMTVVETVDAFGILMNDIDFNNSNFYNITQAIYWVAEEIDGQGHTVSNLLMKDITEHNIWFRKNGRSGTKSHLVSTVKNIVLEMVFITTVSCDIALISNWFNVYIESESAKVNFENVDFRITRYQAYNNANDALFKGITGTYCMNFSYCVFNIYYVVTIGTSDIAVFKDSINLNSCQTNITFQKTTTNNMIVYNSLMSTYNVATFVHFNDTSTYKISVYNTTVNNSYVVADNLLANPDPTSPCHTLGVCPGTAASVVFYDNETVNPTTSTPDEYKITVADANSANVHSLTTAQCKNATDLNTIGFIIAI